MIEAEERRRRTETPIASEIIKEHIARAFWPLVESRARYKGFYGGRGSGKTHSFAAALVVMATFEPMRVLCCREYQRSIKESVKFTLEGKIARLGLSSEYTEVKQTELRTRIGSQFIFEGLRTNPVSIQSYEGITHVWIEEAQTVSQASLDILVPTIRRPGSEIWCSWNPRNETDPVDRMFRKHTEGNEAARAGYDHWMLAREVSFEDNPYFPDVLRAELERDRNRDPDKYAHVWLGKYQHMSSARVFKNWKVGVMEVPDNAVPYFGADWGFSIDPTVLVRCYVFGDSRVLYVDAEVSEVGCPIDKTPALFDELDGGMARYWPIRADSSRPETIQYMETHGYRKIIPARKGPGSVEEGVQFLQNFDIVVHPNCKRVIDELTLYSYEIDKLTNDVLPRLADEDNHTIDALRYAVEDVRRATRVVKPIVVTSPLSINYG